MNWCKKKQVWVRRKDAVYVERLMNQPMVIIYCPTHEGYHLITLAEHRRFQEKKARRARDLRLVRTNTNEPCEGKRRYGTVHDAWRSILDRPLQQNQSAPYYCPTCHGWHLGDPRTNPACVTLEEYRVPAERSLPFKFKRPMKIDRLMPHRKAKPRTPTAV
jgi:hypothetical protein